MRDTPTMGATHFVTVFDVARTGFRNWDFPAFGLIFIALGVVFFFAPRLIAALKIPFFDFGSWRFKFFRYSFIGFALFWTAIAFTATYLPFRHHLDLAENGRCRTIEGSVENFVPMPYEGHADESFAVRDVRFSYSDFEMTDAFNNSASHGGPIRAGEVVRICYDPDDHAILRLAIRDFNGKLPDYSKGEIDFNPPPAGRGKMSDMPWTVSLFVYLYFLEALGRFLMIRPYLRLCPRISREPVMDGAISTTLQEGIKFKLSHILALLDRVDGAIWLRPRGLNFLSLPLVVAKLRTDPAGFKIADIEVRFAIGFALVMIAFFWGAYTMFSAVGDGNPAPRIFLGVFAVVATGSFIWNARRQAKRMRILVDAALTELKSPHAA